MAKEKVELTKDKPTKQSLLIPVLCWAMITIVVVSIFIILKRAKEAHELVVKEALEMGDEYAEYRQQGKELPSNDFKKLIPEMKSFLDKMQPVMLELNAVKRNWELGINFLEFKSAILRIGIACDGIPAIPNCYEAERLVSKAKDALYLYNQTYDYWKKSIDYLTIEYKEASKQSQGFRDEYIQKALKQSQEFNDYYNYLMEECEKRKIKRKN